MEERARGIILRTRRLTETSLIVHWLTEQQGRIHTVARGALRPKSSFRGKLDLFYEAEFTFARSRRSELHTLRELTLLETHREFRTDLEKLRQASYAAALIEQTTESDTPVPELRDLFMQFASALRHAPAEPRNVFAFELQLLALHGLAPNPAETRLTPGTKAVVERLVAADWPSLGVLKLTSGQQHELRQFLHGYLIHHLGRIPKGRAAAIAAED